MAAANPKTTLSICYENIEAKGLITGVYTKKQKHIETLPDA